MERQTEKQWVKGELFQLICLFGIAECVWLIGVNLGVFSLLQKLALEQGLADFVMLGCIMSLAMAFASAYRSFALRRSMAAHAEATARAQNLARHDSLTGLANRRLLAEAVTAAQKAGDQPYAMLLVDLDRFKPVNDIHGHPAGDALLCEMADRISHLLGSSGVVSRIGGDEFAIFLSFSGRVDDLMRLAQQTITAVSAPFMLHETRLEIGATIGISLMPSDGHDASSLLRCADIALYRGKKEGRSTFRFFEQSMDEELRARANLESELRSAVAEGEIKPYYQPLVALKDQSLLGFEVLARWHHKTEGVLSPELFISTAEDTGLISELSYSLLREACLDARQWPPHLGLAINISPYQLRDRWLPERVIGILTETGFAPSRLEIEITETALATDLDLARRALTSLQNCGIKIALDDFGTGYSSLYHLRELKFDKIKIDRSFVQELNQDGESTKIVDAIINLGKSLGLLTTAEGIESNANREWLAEQGCSFGQGFLFGAPMAASTIDALLVDTNPGALGGVTPIRAQDPRDASEMLERQSQVA